MHYATIKKFDIANGEGVRVSLFVSGCSHRCPGCFNDVAWPFEYGHEFTKETEDEIIEACNNSYIKGLSLLGVYVPARLVLHSKGGNDHTRM